MCSLAYLCSALFPCLRQFRIPCLQDSVTHRVPALPTLINFRKSPHHRQAQRLSQCGQSPTDALFPGESKLCQVAVIASIRPACGTAYFRRANVSDASAEVGYLYGTSHAFRVQGWLLVPDVTIYPLLIAFLIDQEERLYSLVPFCLIRTKAM